MSKKNQSFAVSLKNEDKLLKVFVDDQEIGQIEENQGSFVGTLGKQVVIAAAQSEDEALQTMLASYNLYY
ncbi:DUF2969 family protein [Fructobacillus fructosus]|uniref:DUF2969 domain-containing protein n=1 Tax=Fructobacillus fructosus TaxID=1631 RepID=A0ABN9YYI1_9LACO|nr:DUF2969 family protein [Fructobacillus fructosus]MBD9366499.1 DUF2969 family protein [Leuconostoc mesenteroides]KRN52907.1 hypothetical protein IV71_GL000802 [Fructobacillus fructosus KCTC 3544]MBC9119266.1 DUF2969 family protein [Fructobacillus fructosus]MCK8638892.1 DUF2969 domain-containing protein [Fructobacillus fructosus]CAK1242188.1 hypothetical protein R54866_LGPIEIPA_00948 [Fructobacillus fructosus]